MARAGVREVDIAAAIGCSLSTLRKHFREDLPSDWQEPLSEPLLRVISLGAGVQSTALVLMAAAGEIGPMPDAALYADTRSDPQYVYDHLDWLRSLSLPFPVRIIDGGDLGGDLAAGRYGREHGVYPAIPYFVDTGKGRGGLGIRGCTGPYKIQPLMREQRKMLGPQRGNKPRPGSVEVWLGISTDEAQRMKPASAAWQVNRFPLIEAGLSRADCIAWFKKRGYPVPRRSACVFCPYSSDEQWRDLREHDPAGWQKAVSLDDTLRDVREKRGVSGLPYLHRSMKPLTEVTLDDERDLFGNECNGICGT